MKYDVIVVGLGAMGSAATYQLARAGSSVLGIDQFAPPHDFGSSHGDTRITRLAVGEGPEYVPLAQRSHEIWRELEQQTGLEILSESGGLIMRGQSGRGHKMHGIEDFVGESIAIAEQHGIDHDVLDAKLIRERFPQLNVSEETTGYYEPKAGYILLKNAINAQLSLAKKLGATLKLNEKALSWESNHDGVTVTTSQGTYHAGKLILSAGAWIPELIPEYARHFRVYRQLLYWFDIKDQASYEQFAKMPILIWLDGTHKDGYIYAFPAVDGPSGGLKIAFEYLDKPTTADSIDRVVSEDEMNTMFRDNIQRQVPGLTNKCLKAYACMFTVTPDYKFVIDFHPKHRNVIIASPCSGHGFKHSAAIGEVLSELATTGTTHTDISKFAISRLVTA